MEINTNDFCILVASHITNIERIYYLYECLQSLLLQTMPVSIYLSISFDTDALKSNCNEMLINEFNLNKNEFLNVEYQSKKTPQMMHYKYLTMKILTKHKWVMFCDDDDTYKKDRTVHIGQLITFSNNSINEKSLKNKIGGVYESTFGKTHYEQRHEYWCYCINIELLEFFYKTLEDHPRIIADKCCDVLLGEYLRRKSNIWSFIQMPVQYYNYRIEDNAGSITGIIQSKQSQYILNQTPPNDRNSVEWTEYVSRWNKYIQENISVFLHDTYLRSIIGYSFKNILQTEFKNNYVLLPYVNNTEIKKLKNLHDEVIHVTTLLYDIPLSA